MDIILQSDIVRRWNKWHFKDILPILSLYSMTLNISSIGRFSDIQSDCSSFQTWPSECVKASLILCLRERSFCGSTLQRLLDTFPEVKKLDEVWGTYWPLLASPSNSQHACKIFIKLFAKEADELWRGFLRLKVNSLSLNLRPHKGCQHTAVCGRYHS
jgi:hypothetical protein